MNLKMNTVTTNWSQFLFILSVFWVSGSEIMQKADFADPSHPVPESLSGPVVT